MSEPGSDARTRTALLRHFITKLQPLFEAHDLRVDLGGWLNPLPVHVLAECLHLDPLETADALSTALMGEDGTSPIVAQLTDLAVVEYPRLLPMRQDALARFAATVRRIAVDGDSTVSRGALLSEGWRSPDIDDLMPKASRLLAMLGGAARTLRRLPEDQTNPAGRLARAGERAAARRMAA